MESKWDNHWTLTPLVQSRGVTTIPESVSPILLLTFESCQFHFESTKTLPNYDVVTQSHVTCRCPLLAKIFACSIYRTMGVFQVEVSRHFLSGKLSSGDLKGYTLSFPEFTLHNCVYLSSQCKTMINNNKQPSHIWIMTWLGRKYLTWFDPPGLPFLGEYDDFVGVLLVSVLPLTSTSILVSESSP